MPCHAHTGAACTQVLTVMDRDSVEAVAPSPREITVTYPHAPPNALIGAAVGELEQARPSLSSMGCGTACCLTSAS